MSKTATETSLLENAYLFKVYGSPGKLYVFED